MSESKLKKAAQDSLKEHYYLVAGEVVFVVTGIEGEDPTPNSARCNAVVRSTSTSLNVAALARAQQALQQQFHQKISGADEFQVLDVIIQNLIHLGIFTQEEFQRLPEGMTIQQREPISMASSVTATIPD